MRFLTAVLCALALVGCAPRHDVHAPDFSQIRAATKQLDANMEVAEGKTERFGFCSAVAIDEHTLLTAAHCDIGKDIFVNGYRAFIAKKDEARDLMLLNLPYGGQCPCVSKIAVLNAGAPERDSRVFVVGFPLDAGQVLTEGRYEGPAVGDRGIKGLVLLTAPLTWGNSGGGVFARLNGEWVLVGIVSRGTVHAFGFMPVIIGHLNYAAGAESIYRFITGDES